MTTQPDLFSVLSVTSCKNSGSVSPAPASCKNSDSPFWLEARDKLTRHLHHHKTFRTRAQITEALGWTERHLRDVAESLGADIVRCQAGFKLTEDITRDELGIALQASDSFLSQGKRMIRYALSLRKKLHHLIG
jgi:hypothetical protein